MKYASVCSGVEAASLAWMPLGWQAAWFSEIEPFPCAVLKKRYPNVPNLGDMTKIRVENLQNGDQKYYGADGTNVIVSGGVDLLVGGTPCQGFSIAGKQGGLNDDRSVLCLTYIKLLETMRPRWFVWENVPGVFSTNEGDDFKEFIRQIDEIGYHVAWRVLDAQYVRVDGFPRAVPQRRRRVFVIGHLGGWQYPAEVLFEQNCLFRDTPPCRVKGKGFTSDVKRCVGATSTVRMRAGCEGGGKGALVSKELSLTLAAAGNDQVLFYNRHWNKSGVNPTLNQCNAGSGIIGSSNLVVNCYNGSNRITYNNTAPVFYNWHSQSVHASKIEDDVSPTIPAAMGMGGTNMTTPVFIQDTIAIAENVINRKPENGGNGIGAQQEISYTLNSTGVMGVCYGVDVYNQQITGDVAGTLTSASGEPNTSGPKVMSRATVRRLLPVECERLMGFPDNHTRIPWKGKPAKECPDAPRYKACGNSMCVNVMRWIGLRIEIVERKTKQ